MSRRRPRGSSPAFRVFVTATDTGVGKTEVSCALLSLLAESGRRPAAFKPYESGCEELAHPHDAEALRRASGEKDALDAVCPHRFREPLAPGVAAARAGVSPDFRVTLAAYAGFGERPLVVEGAGGLFVPIDEQRDVIDLIATLRLPVILVARAGLGTLNHVALSLEALERRRLPLLAVVLNKSARGVDLSEEDNAALIAHRHGVRVIGPIPYERSRAARQRVLQEALRGVLSGF